MSFECPICLEQVFKSIKFKNCVHKVCDSCYYLLYIHHNFSCPLCRAPILNDLPPHRVIVNTLAAGQAQVAVGEEEGEAEDNGVLEEGEFDLEEGRLFDREREARRASRRARRARAAERVAARTGLAARVGAGGAARVGAVPLGAGVAPIGPRDTILIENDEIYIVRDDNHGGTATVVGCDIVCGIIILLLIYTFYFGT